MSDMKIYTKERRVSEYSHAENAFSYIRRQLSNASEEKKQDFSIGVDKSV